MKTGKAAVMLDLNKPFKEQSISGYRADIVFDRSGVPTAFAEGVQLMRDGGKHIIFGQFMDTGPAETFYPFWIIFKEIT